MKNGGEDGILGARAAVYRGAAVLVGAEDGAARTGSLELGPPCIGEPPYYRREPPYYRRGGQEDTIAEKDGAGEGEGEADLR